MKMNRMVFAVAVLAASVAAARAQEAPPPGGREGKPPPPEVERIMEEIRQTNPEMAEELGRLRQEHPDKFREHVAGMAPMLADPEGREFIKRNLKADFEMRKAMRAYKEAKDPAARKKLEPELRKALEAQFDAKIAGHELKVSHMMKEIERVKAQIEKRRKLKDQMVSKRLAELSGEEEGWDW